MKVSSKVAVFGESKIQPGSPSTEVVGYGTVAFILEKGIAFLNGFPSPLPVSFLREATAEEASLKFA